MFIFRALPVVLLTALFISGGAHHEANAACFEVVGCTDGDAFRERDLARLSCQNLAHVRNSIYAENGYCFRKLDYQRQYGNKACRYARSSAVPLSRLERANVGAVRRVERVKGCSAD